MPSIVERIGTHKPTASEWVSQFIYGEYGAGKTKYAGTAALCEYTTPCIILDVEGGMSTLVGVDIEVKQVRSLDQVQAIQNELYQFNDGHFKCCIIDSASELSKLNMAGIMKAAYNKNPDKVDVDVPSPREYLKSLSQMRAIIRSFKDLPMHTIFTAHSREKVNERTNEVKIGMSLPGQQAMEIPGFTDIVGYLFVDEKGGQSVRKLQTQKTKRVYAKDRFDILGGEVFGLTENPTVSLVMSKIREKVAQSV
jgi:hypothetical protein